MSDITLTFVEMGVVIAAAVGLAATDAAAVSRLFVTVIAKKLGVKPGEIYAFDQATSGEDTE